MNWEKSFTNKTESDNKAAHGWALVWIIYDYYIFIQSVSKNDRQFVCLMKVWTSSKHQETHLYWIHKRNKLKPQKKDIFLTLFFHSSSLSNDIHSHSSSHSQTAFSSSQKQTKASKEGHLSDSFLSCNIHSHSSSHSQTAFSSSQKQMELL